MTAYFKEKSFIVGGKLRSSHSSGKKKGNQVVSLSPNATVFQPLDQGIITNLEFLAPIDLLKLISL